MTETIQQIDYNDEATLRGILIGRRIIQTNHTTAHPYGVALDSIEFVLDNGTILEAREAEGGCACTNGCWTVDNPSTHESVITNVEVLDEPHNEYGDSATLRMFVYTEGLKTELVRSEGGDNGYYGWGYHVYVKRVESMSA